MLPELLGKYVPARNNNGASFAVQDRDFADLAVTAHNQSQFDPVDYLIGAYSTPKQSVSVELSDQGSALGLGVASWSPYIHPDGFETTFGTIQGTRISDTHTGTWSTPDAYAGDVHDPMSQRPFMWNRNNPYVYSDPGGYDVIIMVDPRSVSPLMHMSMVIYNPQTMSGKRYESGPTHVGNIAHASEKITIDPIKDVRSLADYNQWTYHIGSTRAQDAVMEKYWNAANTSAAAGTDRYNAVTNNCDDKVAGALDAAKLPSFEIGKIPSVAGLLLKANGQEINPRDLKPAQPAHQ